MIDGEKEKLTEATTIGYKKIIDLRKVETDALENHIEDIEQIKEIVIDDYHFSEDDSNDDHWVFIKNEKMKYIKK